MPQTHFDTLIIGQGLAGSTLAWHLIDAGLRVGVVDDGHATAASRVAAGLINPLAGMRFSRRPELGDWLGAADAWYTRLGADLGVTLFHPLPMLRLFRSVEQQRFFDRLRADPAATGLLGERFGAADCPEPVAAPHGGFVQRRTGYVDLPLLLDQLRDWLRARDALIERPLDPAQLDVSDKQVRVADLSAERLVFCDGARLDGNPWFGDLPLARGKGQILDLRIEGWTPRHIINGAHWLIPLADGGIRFGATHEHQQIDQQTTPAGRAALLDGLRRMLGERYTIDVTGQQAGIRPGSRDRYPLIGQHPTRSRLWVCNGFGARGALSIPWYTGRLCTHWLHGEALPAEADIRRLG